MGLMLSGFATLEKRTDPSGLRTIESPTAEGGKLKEL
jgi:hypothetical protein